MGSRIVGIIGGTGLGETFARREGVERIETDTPFGRPSAAILRSHVDGVECLFLARHGEKHLLNPSTVPYRANIWALKELGAHEVIATGAVGSLREEIEPGHLVVCDQVIDKTFRRESTFFDGGLAAHVEMAEPFCRRLGAELLEAAQATDVQVHQGGTYVCMEGPQFSTRAESLMHRAWGGDLIGMTCMPEAKLAREAEMCYALVALPTDYDCWRPHAQGADKSTLMDEILANMKRASRAAQTLIDAAIRHLGTRDAGECACRRALEFAIWSDKASLDADTRQRLRPLIGRYVGNA